MSSPEIQFAKNAQRDYRYTIKLISKVFNKPRFHEDGTKSRRTTVANLLVGEWTKYLKEVGNETEIYFRGGKGYIDKNALGEKRVMEAYFIDVGQGDSILVQTPDDCRILIDGGENTSALSFLKWKYRLNVYHKVFDAVIMSHGDSDHLNGLIQVLNDPHIIVKAIYHNGIAKRKNGLGSTISSSNGEELVELYNDIEDLSPVYDDLTDLFKKWVDAVRTARKRAARYKESLICQRVDQKSRIVKVGESKGLKMRFLGPINIGDGGSPRLKTYDSEGKTINGNSVAIRLEYKKAKILLCGDMHDEAELFMLNNLPRSWLKAQVFKANHHGSQYFTTDFLNIIDPWISIVSSGNYNTHGHPRANLLGSLGRYAPRKIRKPLLFSTELVATFKKIPNKSINDRGNYLYEKRTYGLVNVRTNGSWLAAGRVYGKTTSKDDSKMSKFKWEAYAFNIDTGEKVLYDLE